MIVILSMPYCSVIQAALWQNDCMFYNLQFSFWYIFFAAILTYLVWGFIVAFEVVLAMSGSKWAIGWIRKRYKYKQLYREVKVFYPMILFGYFFLEIVPHYIFGVSKMTTFDLEKLFNQVFHNE